MPEGGHGHTPEDQPERRPKVKVTDKRRARTDEADTGTPASPGVPPAAPEPTEVELAKQQAAEYRDHLQRLQAEFDNYRKRVLREQTQAIELASEPLVRRLLEVLDDFELALMAAEELKAAEGKPEFEKLLRGVELVYAKLVDSLRAEGLERIDAEGKPFDPELHEALMGSAGGDGDLLVAEVFRQGYNLKGRVIRPAGVRVAHES